MFLLCYLNLYCVIFVRGLLSNFALAIGLTIEIVNVFAAAFAIAIVTGWTCFVKYDLQQKPRSGSKPLSPCVQGKKSDGHS